MSTKKTFKVGDKVTISDVRPWWTAGKHYEVFEDNGGLHIIDDDGDRNYARVGAYTNDTHLVVEEPIKAPSTSRKVIPTGFGVDTDTGRQELSAVNDGYVSYSELSEWIAVSDVPALHALLGAFLAVRAA